jgi:membrane protein
MHSPGGRGHPMRRIDRVDQWQRAHPWVGFPIAVIFKFFDDQGSYLAALITYYGFVSLFPLLLLLTSILGFVLQGHAQLQQQIVSSALSQFPVIGDQLRQPTSLRGNSAALIIGIAAALYGALGVAQATQNAMNVAWGVPRHRRPNPIKARLRSFGLIATVGIAVLVTTAVSAVGTSASSFGADVSRLGGILLTAIAFLVNVVVFAIAFRVTTARRLSTRQILPGAVVAATIWQVLQVVGSAYVGHFVKGSESTYGVFAIVLGLLAWVHFAALGVVLGVEVNVVRVKHLYPRALLTRGDKQAYTDAAAAQKFKGFEAVHVAFENDGQNASATRAQKHRSAETESQGEPPL